MALVTPRRDKAIDLGELRHMVKAFVLDLFRSPRVYAHRRAATFDIYEQVDMPIRRFLLFRHEDSTVLEHDVDNKE